MERIEEGFLRRAFAAARRARDHGNEPFGAVLVDALGNVVLEGENTVVTERDCTGHAETNLMRLASRRFDPEFLGHCTMYTSTEPCAMCAGAVYWAGVGRVVYGLDMENLLEIYGDDPANHSLAVRAADVLATARSQVTIEGPALLVEAKEVHAGFWSHR